MERVMTVEDHSAFAQAGADAAISKDTPLPDIISSLRHLAE